MSLTATDFIADVLGAHNELSVENIENSLHALQTRMETVKGQVL